MEKYIALSTVVEEGSFTKAAEKLGYTQSALSQMIASLEKDLGVKLLSRSRAGAKLSRDGQRLYPKIEYLLGSYANVKRKADEIRGLEDSLIRISAFSSVATYWLPMLFKKFTTEYPSVEFEIDLASDNYNLEQVERGKSDFAFAVEKLNPNLEYLDLKNGFHLAVLPKGHELAKYATVPLELLAKERFLINELSDTTTEIQIAFNKLNLTPNTKFSIENDASILAMVEQGLGVSVLSALTLYRQSYDVEIRPIEPPIERHISLAWRKRDDLPNAANRFIEFVIKQSPNLP